MFRAALVAILGVVATLRRPREAHARKRLQGKRRRRLGMVIDLDRCTACGACAVACAEENNVPVGRTGPDGKGMQIEWLSMLWREGESPHGLPEMLPFPCQHCNDAPCVKVCPVDATFKDEDGFVVQVTDRCIGCRYCVVACPYSRRFFNWEEPKWQGSLVQLLNPDVGTRPQGVVEKCSFCQHRFQDVKERAALDGRAPRDEELRHLPACAASCPSKAITFGDLDDRASAVSELAQGPRAFRLLEELGADPNVVYLKRDRRP
jgi:molybdopterin-containing oxidoreductase family iron-sulfur binding subunit